LCIVTLLFCNLGKLENMYSSCSSSLFQQQTTTQNDKTTTNRCLG
jgi:hypothetical protein